MNRKTIAVFFLLTLVILIGIPESFAYPQYGGSCSTCHAINAAQNGLGNEMGTNNVTVQNHGSIFSTANGDKKVVNVLLAQGNAQTGDITTIKEKTPRQKMDPIRLSLGIIGTALVVISQFYSLRKREVVIQNGSIKSWLKHHTYFGLFGPLLVLLHAGLPFQFRYADLFNAGTLSTYLMIIVVVSGFIGRYLYRLMDEKGKRLFKYWRDIHIPLVGVLFLTIAIHIAGS